MPTPSCTVLRQGLRKGRSAGDSVCLIEDTTHASANALMTAVGYVDLLIPRGGAGLIRACVENAKVPCIQTGTGICHMCSRRHRRSGQDAGHHRERKSQPPQRVQRRGGVPGALCHCGRVSAQSGSAPWPEPRGKGPASGGAAAGRARSRHHLRHPGRTKDFDTEFLDYILAVKVVDSVDEAIGHIAEHSTGHSEAILTRTQAHADLFTAAVDSAAVYVNCSTRFTDGGEFGLGARWASPPRSCTPAARWDWTSFAATSTSSTEMGRSAEFPTSPV